MKKIRTRRFFATLLTFFGLSVFFLLWMRFFGIEIAKEHLWGVICGLLCVISLAMVTFVAFCFLPYFRGDRRWFFIPTLLTVVFFIGTALLFGVPIGEIGG